MTVLSLTLILCMGVLPAAIAVRSWMLAIPLSAAVAVSTSALGASIATLIGGHPVVWCFAVILTVNLVAGVYHIRTTRERACSRRDEAVLTLAVCLPPLFSLSLFPPSPMGWDPRSIWWFHASWFLDGTQTVRDGLTNPALEWSHPTYPPGVPGLIALVWKGNGGENLMLAQSLTTVLTALAFGALAWVLVDGHRTWTAVVAAATMTLVVSALGGQTAAHGYVDVLYAAFLATALAAAIGMKDARSSFWTSGIALAAALSTKNEAAFFAVTILPIAVVLTPHSRRTLIAAFAVAMLPFGVWRAALIEAGAPPDPAVGQGSVIGKLFTAEAATRFRIAGTELLREVGPIAGVSCVVLGLLTLVVGVQNWRDLRRPIALTAATIATVLTTPLIYALGTYEIQWWLASSLQRVATLSNVFAIASLVAMTPTIHELITRRLAHPTSPTAAEAQLPVTGGLPG